MRRDIKRAKNRNSFRYIRYKLHTNQAGRKENTRSIQKFCRSMFRSRRNTNEVENSTSLSNTKRCGVGI